MYGYPRRRNAGATTSNAARDRTDNVAITDSKSPGDVTNSNTNGITSGSTSTSGGSSMLLVGAVAIAAVLALTGGKVRM